MNERTIIIEPINQFGEDTNDLRILQESPSILKLIRLFFGFASIKEVESGVVFKQRYNFGIFPYKRTIHSCRELKKNVLQAFPDGFDISDLVKYIDRNKRINTDFYNDILLEIKNSIVFYNRKNYTLSFVYLYRVLETISFAFPQIYALQTKDFRKNYESLKKYFNGDTNAGELKFFNTFCQIELQEFSENTITIKIDAAEDLHEQLMIFNKLKEIAEKTKTFKNENAPYEIEIDFVNYGAFFAELRNRFFHFLRGHWADNIKTSEIQNPENMFKPLVYPTLNWLCLLMTKMIETEINKAA